MLRITAALFVALSSLSARAADWPQWMGPTRDGVWTETGVTEKFPAKGPRKVWQVPAGGGYSGPAVVGGRVYLFEYVRTMGDPANDPLKRAALTGTEQVRCLDAKTGKELWKHAYACPYAVSYPCGPRCTPTVAGGRVYALGAMGCLYCLDAATGKVVWEKDFAKDFKAPVPTWGFAAHPLVLGGVVVCMVGAPGGAVMAFDAATGEVKWTALPSEAAGYCPPTVATLNGEKHLVVWHPKGLVGLDPDGGKVRWHVKLEPLHGMAVAAPRRFGDHLFCGGYDGLSLLLKFEKGTANPKAMWRGDRDTGVSPTNSTPLIHDGTLYGCCSASGALRAVALTTGKRLWEDFAPTTGRKSAPYGTAFLTRNGDLFYLMSETGELVIARLTPTKYEELGRAKLLEPTGTAFGRKVAWAAPAFADRHVFVRNDECIACYDLSAKAK